MHCTIINRRFPLEFEDNLPTKEIKPDGSVFSAITDDTKNSSPSFDSSVKSQKTDDSYLESPSTKSRHELRRRALILQAENHRCVRLNVLRLYILPAKYFVRNNI